MHGLAPEGSLGSWAVTMERFEETFKICHGRLSSPGPRALSLFLLKTKPLKL